MQNFPTTGSPGSDSPYRETANEGQSIDRFSDEQRQYVDAVPGKRAAAAADPAYNGADANRRLHGG